MLVLAAPPPPLPASEVLILLVDLAILLCLAVVLGRLATRLRMPAVAGELLTGVVLGPSLLGHAVPSVYRWLLPDAPAQMSLLDAVSQLGVLLLVAMTGSYLDLGLLRRRRAAITRVSVLGLVLPLALGVALGFVLPRSLMGGSPHRYVFALFLGVALCVSAIPVISKTLSDMNLTHRDVGQLILGAGLVDDVFGWLLLSVVSGIATAGFGLLATTLSVGYLVGFVVLAVLVGGPLIRASLRLASRTDQPGPAVAVAVVTVLAGAAIAQSMKMEPVFGAFVAGILIGTARRSDLMRLVGLRTVTLSVLAPIFLATAGLRMDLTALRRPVIALASLVVLAVAVAGKFAGAYAGSRLSQMSRWESLAVGAGMNTRGVIGVIVAMTGLRLGVLDTATYTIVVLVAIATSVMAPPLLRVATTRVAHSEEELFRRAAHEELTARSPVNAELIH